MSTHSKDQIIQDLVGILEDMTSDWDLEFDGSIGAGTKLMEDLEFESIDVVQFVTAIEEHYGSRGLPFEELLMVDGRYVDEVVVENTADFLVRHLNAA